MPIQSTCTCTVCLAYRASGCRFECAVVAGQIANVCGWCAVTHGQPISYSPVAEEAVAA